MFSCEFCEIFKNSFLHRAPPVSTSEYQSFLWSCPVLLDFFAIFRSSPPEMFLGKGVLKKMQLIYRRTPMPKCDFNKVSINFIEITLRHRFSQVNLLHIFRIPFLKNNSGQLLLTFCEHFWNFATEDEGQWGKDFVNRFFIFFTDNQANSATK